MLQLACNEMVTQTEFLAKIYDNLAGKGYNAYSPGGRA